MSIKKKGRSCQCLGERVFYFWRGLTLPGPGGFICFYWISFSFGLTIATPMGGIIKIPSNTIEHRFDWFWLFIMIFSRSFESCQDSFVSFRHLFWCFRNNGTLMYVIFPTNHKGGPMLSSRKMKGPCGYWDSLQKTSVTGILDGGWW